MIIIIITIMIIIIIIIITIIIIIITFSLLINRYIKHNAKARGLYRVGQRVTMCC